MTSTLPRPQLAIAAGPCPQWGGGGCPLHTHPRVASWRGTMSPVGTKSSHHKARVHAVGWNPGGDQQNGGWPFAATPPPRGKATENSPPPTPRRAPASLPPPLPSCPVGLKTVQPANLRWRILVTGPGDPSPRTRFLHKLTAIGCAAVNRGRGVLREPTGAHRRQGRRGLHASQLAHHRAGSLTARRRPRQQLGGGYSNPAGAPQPPPPLPNTPSATAGVGSRAHSYDATPPGRWHLPRAAGHPLPPPPG